MVIFPMRFFDVSRLPSQRRSTVRLQQRQSLCILLPRDGRSTADPGTMDREIFLMGRKSLNSIRDGFGSENSRTPPNMGWIELPQDSLVTLKLT